MNEAVRRFLDEMGAVYAEQGDRDVSPILFKADDDNGGMLFELSLPKGEPHPYWRVREREMTTDEIASLIHKKASYRELWSVDSLTLDMSFRVRGYVYNARQRNEWNLSIEKVEAV